MRHTSLHVNRPPLDGAGQGRATPLLFPALAVLLVAGCTELDNVMGPPGHRASVHDGGEATFTLTFDEVISGATAYDFDANGDGETDVVFSTGDTFGFSTMNPSDFGIVQAYIDGSALEGSAALAVSLHIDFPEGAVGQISYGFAVNEFSEGFSSTIEVFDEDDASLGSQTTPATFTALDGGGTSSFPEGLATVSFDGVASYATISFSGSDRYFLDNFTWTVGAAEPPDEEEEEEEDNGNGDGEGDFAADGFLPPFGGEHRLGSTLPLKVLLSVDGSPVTNREELDAALAAMSLPAAECVRLAVFAGDDLDTDLGGGVSAASVGPRAATQNASCFRFTDDGHLLMNARLESTVFTRGESYTLGLWLHDELVLPENRTFSVF